MHAMIRFLSGSLIALCLLVMSCGQDNHPPETPEANASAPESTSRNTNTQEEIVPDYTHPGRIIAKSGLSVRKYPKMDAPKLGVLPFDTVVRIGMTYGPVDKIEGVRAHWVQLKYGDDYGWIFGGFLEYKDRDLIIPEGKCPPAGTLVWTGEVDAENRDAEQWFLEGIAGPESLELPCLWDLRKLEIDHPWGAEISSSGIYLAISSGTYVTGVLELFERNTLKKIGSFGIVTDPEDAWGFDGDLFYWHELTDSILQQEESGPTQYLTRKYRWQNGTKIPTNDYGTQWLD